MIFRGRLIDFNTSELTVRSQTGEKNFTHSNSFNRVLTDARGSIVEVHTEKTESIASEIKILTANTTENRTYTYSDQTLNPKRIHALKMRARVETEIRNFFLKKDFLETRTPILVDCPGMETHIRPFQVKSHAQSDVCPPYFLPTSPEFSMKKLLVGGLEALFQIAPVFRDEPLSTTHQPEFTMLEWYRAYAGFEKIMEDTEQLISQMTQTILGSSFIPFQNKKIDVTTPWPRWKVSDLFLKYTEIDLKKSSTKELLQNECEKRKLTFSENDTWDDLYFRIWLNLIEPKLPQNRAFFVTHYPASQAALSVLEKDSDGFFWAKRFEAYLGGLELCNAFEELTDEKEQRSRFIKDMNLREKQYGNTFPKTPIDEGFLTALKEGMPPSSGIALGVDRLVMLFSGESDIRNTFWLPKL